MRRRLILCLHATFKLGQSICSLKLRFHLEIRHDLKSLREHLDEILLKTIIRLSVSPANASIIFVEKKDRSVLKYHSLIIHKKEHKAFAFNLVSCWKVAL